MNVASALLWLGVSIILLPLALFCGAVIVIIALHDPVVGFILALIVAGIIGSALERRKKRREEAKANQ